MSNDDSVVPISLEPPPRDQLNERAYVFSLWKQCIIGKIIKEVPEEKDTLRHVRLPYWFQHMVPHIFSVSSSYVGENDRDELIKLIHTIGNEIYYMTRNLFELKIKMNSEMFILYIKNIKLIGGNKVDAKKTVLFLVEKTDLRTEQKYIIACYFCLVTQIFELIKELPAEYVKIFTEYPHEVYHLLALWYYCVTNQSQLFHELIISLKGSSDKTNGEFLLFWAINKGNEQAVLFVYKFFCKNSTPMSRVKFVKYAFHFKSADIAFYLLMKIFSQDHRKLICIEYGYALLSMLATDLRWRDLFMQVSDRVLRFIGEMTFTCGIKTVIRCWIVNESKRYSYGKYFDSFALKHKIDINKNLLHSRNLSMLNVIVELEQQESIALLLKLGRVVEFKPFCINDDIRIIGSQLITRGKIIQLDKLFQDVYPERDERQQFNSYFFEKMCFEICSAFFVEHKFVELDEFLLYFCEENLNSFKENILYQEEGLLIGSFFDIVDVSVWDVMDIIDSAFDWCFNGDNKKIDVCKYELFNPLIEPIPYCMEHFITFICQCMENKGGNSVRILLDWANPKQDVEWRENVLFYATLLDKMNSEEDY